MNVRVPIVHRSELDSLIPIVFEVVSVTVGVIATISVLVSAIVGM